MPMVAVHTGRINMPVDASIYGAAPQPRNPLDTITKLAGAGNALQTNRLLQLKEQQGNVDLQRGNVALGAEEAAAGMQRYKNLAEIVLPLANDPNLSHAKIIDRVAHARAKNLITGDEGTEFLGTLGEDTPDNNRNTMYGLSMRLASEAEKMKQIVGENVTMDTGAQFTSGVREPAVRGGGLQVTQTIEKGLDPATAAQRIPVYDDDAQQMKTVPLGEIGSGAKSAAPPLGQAEASEGASKAYNAAYNVVENSAPRVLQLKSALNALENTKTGVGVEGRTKIANGIIALVGPEIAGKLPGINPESEKFFDEAKKYLTQYASNQPGAMGTDSRLASALTGNASTSINQLAAKDVVKTAIGLERMQQAKVQAFEGSGLPPNAYNKWQADWNKDVDPRVYVFDELSPSEKTKVISSLKTEEKAKFAAQLRQAEANGFVTNPRKEKK